MDTGNVQEIVGRKALGLPLWSWAVTAGGTIVLVRYLRGRMRPGGTGAPMATPSPVNGVPADTALYTALGNVADQLQTINANQANGLSGGPNVDYNSLLPTLAGALAGMPGGGTATAMIGNNGAQVTVGPPGSQSSGSSNHPDFSNMYNISPNIWAGYGTDNTQHFWFDNTSHWLSHGFAQAWIHNGGIAAFGAPTSEEHRDAAGHVVQTFQNAVFEWVPGSNPGQWDTVIHPAGWSAQVAPQNPDVAA